MDYKLTLSDARKFLKYDIRKGDYVGDTKGYYIDNDSRRWYVHDMLSRHTTIDRRGKGFATRKKALVQLQHILGIWSKEDMEVATRFAKCRVNRPA